MKFTYITEDKSMNISLTFEQTTQLVYYRGDKYYPKHTQCILEVNGLIKGVGTVVKYEGDLDNPKWAYIYSAKKALKNLNEKDLRTKFWDQILEYVN